MCQNNAYLALWFSFLCKKPFSFSPAPSAFIRGGGMPPFPKFLDPPLQVLYQEMFSHHPLRQCIKKCSPTTHSGSVSRNVLPPPTQAVYQEMFSHHPLLWWPLFHINYSLIPKKTNIWPVSPHSIAMVTAAAYGYWPGYYNFDNRMCRQLTSPVDDLFNPIMKHQRFMHWTTSKVLGPLQHSLLSPPPPSERRGTSQLVKYQYIAAPTYCYRPLMTVTCVWHM